MYTRHILLLRAFLLHPRRALTRFHGVQGSGPPVYASLSDDPAGYPKAFVVKRLITFIGIVIGWAPPPWTNPIVATHVPSTSMPESGLVPMFSGQGLQMQQ